MWCKLHSQQQKQQQKTKFLPMLCSSLSIKEANRLLHRRCSSTSSSSEEPSSPRVGCMGQVKRKNKVVGFPTVFDVTVNDVSKKTDHISRKNAVKYQKLRSFFFSSSSSPNPGLRNPGSGTHKCRSTAVRNSSCNIAVSSARCTVRTCRSVTDDNNRSDSGSCSSSVRNVVNLEEMDPPLPVVRKKQEEGGCDAERSNLWKRRSGGTPLKTLQLQPLNPIQSRVLLCSASTV